MPQLETITYSNTLLYFSIVFFVGFIIFVYFLRKLAFFFGMRCVISRRLITEERFLEQGVRFLAVSGAPRVKQGKL